MSTLFAILTSLIRVFTICHCHHSDQGLHGLHFSAVWSGSTLFFIFLSSIMNVYTVCHSQQSDQGLHYLSSAVVWSGSTLFAIFSELIRLSTLSYPQSHPSLYYLPFLAVWSGSTLFESLSEQYYQCPHCNSKPSDQSTLLAILSSLIKVYTICYSQQSDQGLHCLQFSAVSSGSSLFAILSKQFYQGLHYAILSSLIRVCIVWHSQQFDRILQYLPFSVWSGSIVFAILSGLIRVYIICRSF